MSVAYFSVTGEVWICLLLNYVVEKVGKGLRLFMRLGKDELVVARCERGRVGVAVGERASAMNEPLLGC